MGEISTILVFLAHFTVNGKAWSGISFCFSITYLRVLNWLQWEHSIKQQQQEKLLEKQR